MLFLWPHPQHTKFPGQGSNLVPASNSCLCSDQSCCNQILSPLCHRGTPKFSVYYWRFKICELLLLITAMFLSRPIEDMFLQEIVLVVLASQSGAKHVRWQNASQPSLHFAGDADEGDASSVFSPLGRLTFSTPWGPRGLRAVVCRSERLTAWNLSQGEQMSRLPALSLSCPQLC